MVGKRCSGMDGKFDWEKFLWDLNLDCDKNDYEKINFDQEDVGFEPRRIQRL